MCGFKTNKQTKIKFSERTSLLEFRGKRGAPTGDRQYFSVVADVFDIGEYRHANGLDEICANN